MKPRSEDRQRIEQVACFPIPGLDSRAELETHKWKQQLRTPFQVLLPSQHAAHSHPLARGWGNTVVKGETLPHAQKVPTNLIQAVGATFRLGFGVKTQSFLVHGNKMNFEKGIEVFGEVFGTKDRKQSCGRESNTLISQVRLMMGKVMTYYQYERIILTYMGIIIKDKSQYNQQVF